MNEVFNLLFLYRLKVRADASDEGKMELLEFCMEQGLIADKYECPECLEGMTLRSRKGTCDGYEWACRNSLPKPHHVKRSVRTGSWFSEARISIIDILVMTEFFVFNRPQNDVTFEVSIGFNTVANWRAAFREACLDICVLNSRAIGGENVKVELEGCEFKKRQFMHGKQTKGTWLYFGVEQGTKKHFLKVVQKKDNKSLFEAIKDYILPGTNLISDCAKELIGNKEFGDLMYERSIQFVKRETIPEHKRIWRAVRSVMPRAALKGHFAQYLAEYLWLRQHSSNKDPMRDFIEGVARVFPPSYKDTPLNAKKAKQAQAPQFRETEDSFVIEAVDSVLIETDNSLIIESEEPVIVEGENSNYTGPEIVVNTTHFQEEHCYSVPKKSKERKLLSDEVYTDSSEAEEEEDKLTEDLEFTEAENGEDKWAEEFYSSEEDVGKKWQRSVLPISVPAKRSKRQKKDTKGITEADIENKMQKKNSGKVNQSDEKVSGKIKKSDKKDSDAKNKRGTKGSNKLKIKSDKRDKKSKKDSVRKKKGMKKDSDISETVVENKGPKRYTFTDAGERKKSRKRDSGTFEADGRRKRQKKDSDEEADNGENIQETDWDVTAASEALLALHALKT